MRWPASVCPCCSHWWLTVVLQATIHTEDVISKPQDSRNQKVQAGVCSTQRRRQHCGKRRRENADHVNNIWGTIEVESRSEDQNEEHQQARALASPDLSSRREVEDHSLTHVPFTIWCIHCLGGRGRRSAHKWRHNEGEGMDNRAVTP